MPYEMPCEMPYGMPCEMPYGMPCEMPYGMPYEMPYGMLFDDVLSFFYLNKENKKLKFILTFILIFIFKI